MKKPKLTKGNWKFDKEGVCVLSEKDWIIADCFNSFSMEYEQNANAKAIAQVPNLIDDLIVQNRALKHQLKSLDWLESQNVDIGSWVQNQRELIEVRLRNNEQVLTDAGASNE